jgi:response regulator RpfG family c-di-GMP phosphodiesterase
MKRQVLFVDDEFSVLAGLRRMLHPLQNRWEMHFVHSADDALDLARAQAFDVIVSDVRMPLKDGFELLAELRGSARTQDIPVIMLTGTSDTGLKRRALDMGVTDLLNKPIAKEDLVARVQNALRLKSIQDELKDQNKLLEARVRERTSELTNSRVDIIWRLGKAGEYRDENTGNHVIRVGCYSRIIAEKLGADRDFVEMLFLTSPLHDIGKIGIPDRVLLKRGALTHEERMIMQQHCEIGGEILRADLQFPNLTERVLGLRHLKSPVQAANPLLSKAARIAQTHHERWDGSGYPACLTGEEIPLESRIVALSDAYDALSTERPYKPPFSETEVRQMLDKEAGSHFDPAVHAAFTGVVEEFRAIRHELADDVSVTQSTGALW